MDIRQTILMLTCHSNSAGSNIDSDLSSNRDSQGLGHRALLELAVCGLRDSGGGTLATF